MSKKAFDKIAEGLTDAIAIARNEADPKTYRIHVPSHFDVKKLRKKLGLSQEQFAQHYGFTPARVRDWEQGRSNPTGAIRAYLIVIARQPEAVERALTAKVKGDELERVPEYA
jgi:putative transcriptional regulator